MFPRPPLKFRTVGFPQYGSKRTFKPATFTMTNRFKCRPHAPAGVAYTLVQCPNPTHPSDSKAVRCRGACARNRPRILRFNRTQRLPTSTRSSRGPWLAGRLCCPPRSSLTMASSEPLDPRQSGLCFCPRNGARGNRPRAAIQRFPNLLRQTVRPCRLPYPGGPVSALGCCFLTSNGLRLGVRGSASAMRIFEAAEFA